MVAVVVAADVGRFGRWGAKGGVPREVLLDIRQSWHKNLGKSKILRAEVLDFGFSDPVGYYLKDADAVNFLNFPTVAFFGGCNFI